MKKNGFVFIETVVVICILSVTLLILYSSYSHILRVTKQKSTFDTTDSIYTTFYVKKVMDSYLGSDLTFDSFFTINSSYCRNIHDGMSYVCDISAIPDSDMTLKQLNTIYDVDKVYYLSPKQILDNANADEYLMEVDATTIDYIKSLGVGVSNKILIVKYKHTYPDNSYEVFHASMEV